MSASPSYDVGQFHPEFGYFAPTMRFRSKVWLALKAVTLGVLAGAVAVFFLTMEREEKALTMLATPVTVAPVPLKPAQVAMPAPAPAPQQTQAPRIQAQTQVPPTNTWMPVRFLPESMAVPSAVPRTPEVAPPLRPSIATAPTPPAPSTVGASPVAAPAPVATPAPAATPVPATMPVAAAEPATTPAPAAAPVAKAAAKPKKKIVRDPPPEPEPRAAYASPPRPFGLPIFGFGWQR